MSLRSKNRNLAGLSQRDAELTTGARTPPWTRRLTIYTRTLAAFSLAKGLYHWALLIGVGAAGDPFAGRTAAWRIATVYFSVADLVAAVGLWLGAAWGVVIWLLAVVSQLLVSGFAPAAFGPQWGLTGLQLVAIGVYVALSTLARRETSD
jgi:hypothetical protein